MVGELGRVGLDAVVALAPCVACLGPFFYDEAADADVLEMRGEAKSALAFEGNESVIQIKVKIRPFLIPPPTITTWAS